MLSNIKLIQLCVLTMLVSACSLDSEYFDPTTTNSYSLDFETDNIDVEEVSFTSNENKIAAVLVTAPTDIAPESTETPTILYFHGDDKDIDKFVPRLDELLAAGLNVFIFDFQGYGKSEGSPSLAGIKQNSVDALNYLKTRTDKIDPDRIVFYAFSLGGVFAMYVADEVEEPLAIITEAIPASSDQSVRQNVRLGIPSSYFFDETFDNLGPMSRLSVPVLMFHGKKDATLSFKDHARPLFKAAPEELRTTVTLEDAGHSNIIESMGEENYRESIQDFLDL